MGFFTKLFSRKKQREEIGDDWENIVYDREDVDFRQDEQRINYVTNCLEQIADAEKEVKLLSGEYSLVTSYLTDMEEIEALPKDEREDINSIARRMVALDQERKRYQDKKNRMRDSDYYRLRKLEDELQEGIRKLKEGESYAIKIKQDLQRLDRERHAYEYRRKEIETILNNLRGMIFIFLIAFAVCMIMLLILQYGFGMNTQVGYLLAGAAVGIAVAAVGVKYSDEERELSKVERSVNKLILLQNKVKVRYVNNSNLINYLYIKYNTTSAAELEKLWKQYLEEKEERKQYAEAEAKIDYYQKQLTTKLSNFRVVSPERWAAQPAALLDNREMVEMRHELILRRQALRKQLDYNNKVAETARNEIQEIMEQFPSFEGEIVAMMERYQA